MGRFGAGFTALYDACVLYPAPLRDLLVELAGRKLFRARWSRAIHEEWIRNLLANRPDLTRERLERTAQRMDAAVLDALVEGYEDLIPDLHLPDEGDRHVLAAAIMGRADVIVTLNIRDFPAAVIGKHGISVLTPDEFVLDLLDLSAEDVLEAIGSIVSRLKNPPVTLGGYLDNLAAQGLEGSVQELRLWEFERRLLGEPGLTSEE